MAGALGFEDINFESEEFSRAFFVKCPEKKFAYDVIDPRMMQFLLDTRPHTLWIKHGNLCVSNGSGQWNPEEFEAQIKVATSFLDRWPRHVQDSLLQGAPNRMRFNR